MKKLIFSSFVLLSTVLFVKKSEAQIAGNAVYANGNSTYNYNAGSGGVDLNLASYSYTFSNIIEANVMMNVKATAYVAIFSITQHGNTIEEAETAMRNRVDIFKNLLQQSNTALSQVFVDPVSLVPEYEIELTEKKFSKTLNEVPSGFEIKKNVHITFKDQDEINNLVATAAKAEVYDLVKVDYSIPDMESVLAQLREKALAILLQKKTTLEKGGLHLRFNQMGEKYGSVYPLERYSQYYAYKTGVAPKFILQNKKGQPQQQVQYNYAEKNKTIYYDKVSDKQFDLIINPVVGEPEVQVYLSLKGQFEKYNPESEAADKAYAAKLRELDLRERELNLQLKTKELGLAKAGK
jgi:hypothetical protein